MIRAIGHELNEVSQVSHWCAVELEHLHIAVVFIPQSCIAGQHLRQDNHLHSIATPHATAVQHGVKWQQTRTFAVTIAAHSVYSAGNCKACFFRDAQVEYCSRRTLIPLYLPVELMWQCQYAHYRN